MRVSSRAVAAVATSTLCLALLLPLAAGAQGGEIESQFSAAARGAGTGQQASANVEEIVANIIKVSLSIIGVLMVALLVYGGYLWMTAGGEEEKITKAKQIIRNAIIGIAIVLSAYAISVFVVNRLLYATRGQL